MHVLCVAEKPSIAKSVSQILSSGQFTTRSTRNKFIKNYDFTYPRTNDTFTVTSVSGHLMSSDFGSAYRSWSSCDPVILFDVPVETKVAEDKKSIEQNLLSEARGCQTLMIWTDCDREGENIGMEIANVCKKANRNLQIKRARFSAIIAQQIHHAVQNPIELDKAQADAVDARTILDLRLGAAFTRMQSLILQQRIPELEKQMISYGPCQFPTLGFVVARYEQVQSFSPETFWYIYLTLRRLLDTKVVAQNEENEEETEFTWRRGRLFDFDVSLAIYEIVLKKPTAKVTKVTQKPTKKWKPLPLTTVELQKSGSRLLKLAPKRILDIAEKLYQQGFLSYPRTETDQYDNQFDFMSLINKQVADPNWGPFAVKLQESEFAVPRKGKKNDQAHPPIHPTAYAAGLSGDEKRVYEYIARRFLASCSKDAEGWETTVDVVCGGEEFFSTGLVVIHRNYLDVFPYDKWTGKYIPAFEEGEEFIPSVCELKEGQTTRPSLITEADLVGLMDKNGIGTDATIAQHIQTIIDREYVMQRKEGTTTYLVPSTLGIGLVEGYNAIGFEKSLSKPQLRRETERKMVRICEGGTTKQLMLAESIEQYKEVFLRARNQFENVVASVQKYLREPNPRVQLNGQRHDDGSDGGGSGGGGGGGDGGGGGGGGGRGGNGPNHRRNQATNRARGNHKSRNSSRPPQDNQATSRVITQAPRVSAVIQPGNSQTHTDPSRPTEALCKCSLPTAERTVVKESANQGRKFRTCGNNNTCDFFEWVDGPSSSTHGLTAAPPKRKQPGSTGGGAKRCTCDMTAVQRTVTKEGPNTGRVFWSCPNSERARCKFFEWDDGQGPSNNAMSPRQTTSVGSMQSGECFKCGEAGHWSSACPNGSTSGKKQNTGRTYGASQPSGDCFKCGDSGHWSSACPNDGGFGGSSKPFTSRGKRRGSGGRRATGGQNRGKRRGVQF